MVHSKRHHAGDVGAAADRSPPKWCTKSLRSIRKCRKRFSRCHEDTPAPQKFKSSRFRGVTKHRITNRFEAHLWDKDAYNDKSKKRGRQVYLGAYKEEDAAAHAYDLAALKYWGPGTLLNFKLEDYAEQLKDMAKIPRGEYLASLRRKSSGFSRGVSRYRGVARHHHKERWEARIGRVEGNKYLYLGTFSTQEEAAVAYDLAAIKYRGRSTPTNFDVSRYPNAIQDTQAKKGSKNNASKRRLKRKCKKIASPTKSEDEASSIDFKTTSIDSDTTKSDLLVTSNDEKVFFDDAQSLYADEDTSTMLMEPLFDQESLPMDLLDPKCEEDNVDSEFSIPEWDNASPYNLEGEDNNYIPLIVVPMPHVDPDQFCIESKKPHI